MSRVEFFSDKPARGINMKKLKNFTSRAAGKLSIRRPVVVVLTGARGIRRLNRRFFSKNSATDVIAFDLSAPGAPPEGGICEIYVCLPEAKKAAAALGHSQTREIMLLIAHGLLHLSGMDDGTPPAKKEMLRAGEELLSALKV